MKGTKDITQSDRVSKEVSDDFTRFSVQKSQISDSGTYFVVARNDFGTDRIFVTITVRRTLPKETMCCIKVCAVPGCQFLMLKLTNLCFSNSLCFLSLFISSFRLRRPKRKIKAY